MQEGQFTQKLLREIKSHIPDAVVFKFSDRITRGIPDFSITWCGLTTWFEVKLVANKRPFEPIQYEYLRRLFRGHYIFADIAAQRFGLRHIVAKWPLQTEKPLVGAMNFAELVQGIAREARND